MSRRGRKPLKIPTTRWEVRIRADLAAEVDLILANAVTGVPDYGARSKLIEERLLYWLHERKLDAFVEVKLSPEQMQLLIASKPPDVTLYVFNSTARVPKAVAKALGLLMPEMIEAPVPS